MKLYKSLLIASAIIGGMMTSCSDDGYWDKASGTDLGFLDNGKAYSFKSSTTNYTFEPTDEIAGEVFEIPVVRNNTSGTVTLPITVTISKDSLLECEESVTFEDGQNTAYLKIKPVRDFEIGERSSATLVIDTAAVDIPYVAFPDSSLIKKETSTEADTIEFNRQEAAYETYMRELSIYKLVNKVTVSKVYTFHSLGNAYYREDCITTLYGVENVTYQVEMEECDQIPGYYRLKNPYGEAYEYNEKGDWDDKNDYYLYIHAEDPEGVWIDDSDTGCDWGKGNFEIWSLAGLRMARNGFSLEDCKAQGLTGTLVDGVITMPTRSMLIARATDTGWYYANINGLFAVALPGYSIKDYSAVVAYNGRFINPADEEYILANVTLGPDVAHAWVTVVEGKDNVEAAYNLIADGTIKLMDDEYEYGSGMVYIDVTEDGEYQIPMIQNAPSGKYSIVIFTFDEEGNVIDAYQDYSVVSFNYTSSSEAPETWTAKFIGDYKYGGFYFEGDDLELTLYESDKTEGRYKIEHWGADVDLIFTMAEDGELTIDEVEVGETYSTYGAVYICTQNMYWSAEDYNPETDRSYYADGVFHFNVVYYVSGGRFGYGEETFTLTGNASKERDYMPAWTKQPVNQHLTVTKRHQSKQELMKNANPERFE